MTLSIAPDGDRFMVTVKSLAGENVVGPRLMRWGFENIQTLPPQKVSGLTFAEAVETKRKWEDFLRKQEQKKKV
jgi:hypothetical protein